MSSIIGKIHFFIQLETFVLFGIVLLTSYTFYKTLLKAISHKRHLNLKERFLNTFMVVSTSAALAATHWISYEKFNGDVIAKISNYLAILSLITGAIAVVKLAQIVAYLYLFFKNISQGIPRLIVNLFSVVFSLFVTVFIASEVFSIQVTSMLATSAVFSLVLGLALQDTLGNLFSGVAIQIGQPYRLGDWIEVSSDSKKWTGQVQEITWRATFLSSFSDEWIMIPNKTMAQSQVIILTNTNKVLRHSHLFRLGFDSDMNHAKKIILEVTKQISEISSDPAPRVLLIESTESWLALKVFYSIKDFSLKYQVGDKLLQSILETFKTHQIKLAINRISVEREIKD